VTRHKDYVFTVITRCEDQLFLTRHKDHVLFFSTRHGSYGLVALKDHVLFLSTRHGSYGLVVQHFQIVNIDEIASTKYLEIVTIE